MLEIAKKNSRCHNRHSLKNLPVRSPSLSCLFSLSLLTPSIPSLLFHWQAVGVATLPSSVLSTSRGLWVVFSSHLHLKFFKWATTSCLTFSEPYFFFSRSPGVWELLCVPNGGDVWAYAVVWLTVRKVHSVARMSHRRSRGSYKHADTVSQRDMHI